MLRKVNKSPIYKPRNPQTSQYYQCVKDDFETHEQVYDERFSKQYGFFRVYVKQVIYRYLDCGILPALQGSNVGNTGMSSHIPNKGEQMFRYYGYYSNVSRGKRKNKNWMRCSLQFLKMKVFQRHS